jgi:hypothetical protein
MSFTQTTETEVEGWSTCAPCAVLAGESNKYVLNLLLEYVCTYLQVSQSSLLLLHS